MKICALTLRFGAISLYVLHDLKRLAIAPRAEAIDVVIAGHSHKPLREAADDINAIEARIRDAVPIARIVYIEPDVYRPSIDPEPSTDVFVLKSSD